MIYSINRRKDYINYSIDRKCIHIKSDDNGKKAIKKSNKAVFAYFHDCTNPKSLSVARYACVFRVAHSRKYSAQKVQLLRNRCTSVLTS